MKIRLALLCVVALALTGCAQFPKNAYGENVKVSTPWGSFQADKLATGTAASNSTKAGHSLK